MTATIDWLRLSRGEGRVHAFSTWRDRGDLRTSACGNVQGLTGELTSDESGVRCRQCSRSVARRRHDAVTGFVVPPSPVVPRLPDPEHAREDLLAELGPVDARVLERIDDLVACVRRAAFREATAACREVAREHRDSYPENYIERVQRDAAIGVAVQTEGAIARAARGPRTGIVSPAISEKVVNLMEHRARAGGAA